MSFLGFGPPTMLVSFWLPCKTRPNKRAPSLQLVWHLTFGGFFPPFSLYGDRVLKRQVPMRKGWEACEHSFFLEELQEDQKTSKTYLPVVIFCTSKKMERRFLSGSLPLSQALHRLIAVADGRDTPPIFGSGWGGAAVLGSEPRSFFEGEGHHEENSGLLLGCP